ncbi:MAG: NAD(+)/NADH kinase [Clostridia bacterium]|nr:NAD(+)/NADH kinase [Clostridia bacterium]
MNIALLSKHFKSEICNIMKKIISALEGHECNILMHSSATKYFSGSKIIYFGHSNSVIRESDIVFVVGGDGTIIHYAKEAARFDRPVFGINGGNLGFLASCEKDEISKIDKIIAGNYLLSKRLMLEVEFGDGSFTALNDIVISRDTNSSVLKYSVLRDDKMICGYSADGIILATPTGSTAYSLSAGGPIVDKNLDCVVLTPICPHTLAARSMILDTGKEIFINMNNTGNENEEFAISVDGESNRCKVGENKIIKIKKSKLKAKFIEPIGYDFYDKIRKKLSGDITKDM